MAGVIKTSSGRYLDDFIILQNRDVYATKLAALQVIEEKRRGSRTSLNEGQLIYTDKVTT